MNGYARLSFAEGTVYNGNTEHLEYRLALTDKGWAAPTRSIASGEVDLAAQFGRVDVAFAQESRCKDRVMPYDWRSSISASTPTRVSARERTLRSFANQGPRTGGRVDRGSANARAQSFRGRSANKGEMSAHPGFTLVPSAEAL